jgi:N-methylhydantoinase A
LRYEKPSPLVRRRDRREIKERVSASGAVVTALDEDDVLEEVRNLVEGGTRSLAICFINSFANPAHELRAAELVRQLYPKLYVSVSAEINPEVREFERLSATVVNAYVAPVVASYLAQLNERLTPQLLVMQCNGGLQTMRQAQAFPVRAIESGPAAGVVACMSVARRRALDTVLTFDVGGTTAKASLIERGQLLMAAGFEVGGEISMMSRLTGSGGYPVRVPAIDIVEVGAGGGSIARVDAGQAVNVGPRSAGAIPGPVCYSRGGAEPTVTDASVVLGLIGDSLAGGTVPIDRDAAARAITDHIAMPLGIGPVEAADGIFRIANSIMLGGLRAVSLERGRDVREGLR